MCTIKNIFLKLKTRLAVFGSNFFFFLMYLDWSSLAPHLGREGRNVSLEVYQGEFSGIFAFTDYHANCMHVQRLRILTR